MQQSNAPSQIVLPWGNSDSSKTNPIPVASQQGIKPGAASFTDGFPPLCATPVSSGGVPPSKADMDGILYMLSGVDLWSCAGGGYPYSSAFSTAIGGYPKGAIVLKATGLGYWLSTIDNNTSDPDTGGANWDELVATADLAGILAPYAPLASPVFTGDPTAPTAAPGTNTVQLATTAFVSAALAAYVGSGAVYVSANLSAAVSVASGSTVTVLALNMTTPSSGGPWRVNVSYGAGIELGGSGKYSAYIGDQSGNTAGGVDQEYVNTGSTQSISADTDMPFSSTQTYGNSQALTFTLYFYWSGNGTATVEPTSTSTGVPITWMKARLIRSN